jgi:hypothetical protein
VILRSLLQFVGLNMNPGRSITALTVRMSVGTPSTICGQVGRDRHLRRVRVDFDLRLGTTTFPRSNGPAMTGLTIERPNGAPS